MQTENTNVSKNNELLIKHLDKLNVYDLERLKVCFEDEYRYDTANRKNIENILEHINVLIQQKQS